MHVPIAVTLVTIAIASSSATGPWQVSHFMPASRCLRWLHCTPGVRLYTRTQGTGCCDLANCASFTIAGFFVATVLWQFMHVLVAGNVIRAPGSGFVWHVWH